MVRQHGSLTKDDETNEAAWEAARGAAYGGVKVCAHVVLRFCVFFPRLLLGGVWLLLRAGVSHHFRFGVVLQSLRHGCLEKSWRWVLHPVVWCGGNLFRRLIFVALWLCFKLTQRCSGALSSPLRVELHTPSLPSTGG